MSENEDRRSFLPSKTVQHSKALLISEYRNETDAEHVIGFLSSGPKVKPNMQFTKSSVLERVKCLLPVLEQAEKDLDSKVPNDYNIEEFEENDPFIQMDVTIMRKLNEDGFSQSEPEECDNEISDSECDSSESEESCDDSFSSDLDTLEQIVNSEIDSNATSIQIQPSTKKKGSDVPLIQEIISEELISSNKEK